MNSTVCNRGFSATAWLLVLLVVFNTGCATRSVSRHEVPRLAGVTPGVAPDDVDVLELSPAMHAFLDRYVLPYENPDTRLQLLSMALTRSGVLGYQYDDRSTLVAADAFRLRAGNCLSFSNMLVALAREAGLKADYQEVVVEPQWSSQDDTILLSRHINVVVSSRNYRYVIDVTGRKAPSGASRNTLSDAQAKALYYNNLSVEALLENRLADAWANLDKAIGLAPEMSGLWVNMGVIMGRNRQWTDAAQSYSHALRLNRLEYAALSNLYEVYVATGDLASAAAVQRKVEHYRHQNPYYLLELSNLAFEAGRYDESADLLEDAVSKKDDDPALHLALARASYLTGRKETAKSAYQKARSLAPRTSQAELDQPLEAWLDGLTGSPSN